MREGWGRSGGGGGGPAGYITVQTDTRKRHPSESTDGDSTCSREWARGELHHRGGQPLQTAAQQQ